jgi:prolyl-tRNA editing enzyme YbaK/EbsC (Cys-tRNA(Pro) deacylase)
MREKVIDRARQLGLKVDVRSLDKSTATAGDAATAVGCEKAQIAKSLVFVADGEPLLCIAAGDHRVDLHKLCDAVDCAELRQASPEEVRVATGFAVGGVAPIGHDLPVIFDEALLEHDQIWAAAGDGHSVFAIDPRKLVSCTNAQVADVSA